MKTRLLSSLAAFAAVLLLLPLTSGAQALSPTTTTLMTQTFNSSFPPSGWTASLTTSGSINGYGYQPGWYQSTGGVNGATGSAVGWSAGADSYQCSGSSYGPLTLSTPTLSGLASADSQYVDFDAFLPASYYDENYAQIGTIFSVMHGTTTLMSQSIGGANSSLGLYYGGTFYDGTDGAPGTDPAGYSSTTYWRHYHVAIGTGNTSLQLTFV